MSNDLHAFSQQLADLVAGVSPSLVRVLHPRFPGTGIVWSADGLILTTARRARRGGPIHVSIDGGEHLDATLVGRDPSTDLALWRVEAKDLHPATWDEATDPLRVGEIVLSLGRPGRAAQAAFGLVSGVGGAWRSPLGAAVDRFINVDGSLPPGFAGGPLVRADGTLLGLNSRHLAHGGTTVPAETVRRVVGELLAHGEVRRPFLGVGVQQVALPAEVGAELGRSKGLLVSSVEADSPAQVAGLLVGDTLVGLGEQHLVELEDLVLALARAGAGTTTAVELVRGGQRSRHTLEVGSRAAPEPSEGQGRGGRGGHRHGPWHRHGGRGGQGRCGPKARGGCGH